MGRRATKIDTKKVTELAEVGCSEVEIANYFGVASSVISERFRIIFNSAHGKFISELRAAQYHSAIVTKNPTMLKWMGIQHLGQADKLEVENKDAGRAQEVVLKFAETSTPTTSAVTMADGGDTVDGTKQSSEGGKAVG